MLFLSSRAKTRDPRTGDSVRASIKRAPGRVDSRLRGNNKKYRGYYKKPRYPGQRPGIQHVAPGQGVSVIRGG